MKLSEKILTEEDVKDILANSGFEHVLDNIYWSTVWEIETKVTLRGNKLAHLIDWIVDFSEKRGEHTGYRHGKYEIITGMKTLFEIGR